MIGFRKGFQRFAAPLEFLVTWRLHENVVFLMLFDDFRVSVPDFRGGKCRMIDFRKGL